MSVLHTKKCISLTTLLNVLFLLGVFWIISLVHTRRNCNKWRKSLFLPYCITKHYNLCHQYTTSSLWKNATHTNTIYYTTTTRNTIFQYFKSSVVACQRCKILMISTAPVNKHHHKKYTAYVATLQKWTPYSRWIPLHKLSKTDI